MKPSDHFRAMLSMKNTTFTRIDLREEVQNVLFRSPHFAGHNVQFELHGDEVLLKGIVPSYYQKQLAQESLRHLPGLKRIRNELQVVSRKPVQ